VCPEFGFSDLSLRAVDERHRQQNLVSLASFLEEKQKQRKWLDRHMNVASYGTIPHYTALYSTSVRRKSFLVATRLLLAATLTPTPVFAFLRGAERIEGRANLITRANFITIHLRKNREA
jgi:hypothetical protein